MCAYWARLQTGRVGRGADVEEHERAAVGDHLDGQRRPVHARQPPQVQDRRRHAGAGVTGRDDRVRAALADEAHADVDAGVALAAHRGGGVLVHAHRLGRLDDASRATAADHR